MGSVFYISLVNISGNIIDQNKTAQLYNLWAQTNFKFYMNTHKRQLKDSLKNLCPFETHIVLILCDEEPIFAQNT